MGLNLTLKWLLTTLERFIPYVNGFKLYVKMIFDYVKGFIHYVRLIDYSLLYINIYILNLIMYY